MAAIDNAKKLRILRFGADKDWTCLSSPNDNCINATDLLFRGEELCYIIGQLSMKSLKLQHLFTSDHRFTSKPLVFSPEEKVIDRDRGIELIGCNIVESCGGVLVVTVPYGPLRPGDYCSKIVLEGRLVPVNDLGDLMVLVGRGCSSSWSGKGSSCGFSSNNCIYLVTWCECGSLLCRYGLRRCGRDEEGLYRLWKSNLLSKQVVGPLLL